MIGAVIIAATLDFFQDQLSRGVFRDISPIHIAIRTLRQAGVDHILLLSPSACLEKFRQHTARMKVLCLPFPEGAQKLFSASRFQVSQSLLRTLLLHLPGGCQKTLFIDASRPFFSSKTIQLLLETQASCSLPVCRGQSGPILLFDRGFCEKAERTNSDVSIAEVQPGLFSFSPQEVPVADEAMLIPFSKREQLSPQSLPVFPEVKLRLVRARPFFGKGTASLLSFIEKTHSVRGACEAMGMSYSKGWKMLHSMENEIEAPLVLRQQGGRNGGSASLTPLAKRLLKAYRHFEKEAQTELQRIFASCFEGVFRQDEVREEEPRCRRS